MLNEILMTNVLQSLSKHIENQTNYLLDHGLMSSKVAEGFESVKVHLNKLKKYQENAISQAHSDLKLLGMNHGIKRKRSSLDPTNLSSSEDEEGEIKPPKKLRESKRRKSTSLIGNITSQSNTIRAITIRRPENNQSFNSYNEDSFVEEINEEHEISIQNGNSDEELENENPEDKLASDEEQVYKGLGKYNIFKGAAEYRENLKKEDVYRVGKNRFLCKYCKTDFKYFGGLKMHLRLHTMDRPFKCDTCDSSFRRKEHLQAHMVTHTAKRKSIICTICNRGYSSKKGLINHQQTVHEKVIKCDACDIIFQTQNDLIEHEKLHKEDTGYYCDLCSFGFIEEEQFRKHIAKHAEEGTVSLD